MDKGYSSARSWTSSEGSDTDSSREGSGSSEISRLPPLQCEVVFPSDHPEADDSGDDVVEISPPTNLGVALAQAAEVDMRGVGSAGVEVADSEVREDAREATGVGRGKRKVISRPKPRARIDYGSLEMPGYEWVDGEVGIYFSKWSDQAMLDTFVSLEKCFGSGDGEFPLLAEACEDDGPNTDFVFLEPSGDEADYFYAYMCWFEDLGIQLPFDDFQMGVLRALNVAPTQLHPNAWAAMQAFRNLCLCLGLTPRPMAFLYFYTCRPSKPVKWVSLSRVPKRGFLRAFTSSYKGFKSGFFKVRWGSDMRDCFYDREGTPLFPFYWTKRPTRYETIAKAKLPTEDAEIVELLEQLPKELPVRSLLDIFETSHFEMVLLGTYLMLR